jgi:hypothetical protein
MAGVTLEDLNPESLTTWIVVVLEEEMTATIMLKRPHNGGGTRVMIESEWKFLMRICMKRIWT